jgi:hypothetical protein
LAAALAEVQSEGHGERQAGGRCSWEGDRGNEEVLAGVAVVRRGRGEDEACAEAERRAVLLSEPVAVLEAVRAYGRLVQDLDLEN